MHQESWQLKAIKPKEHTFTIVPNAFSSRSGAQGMHQVSWKLKASKPKKNTLTIVWFSVYELHLSMWKAIRDYVHMSWFK